MDHGSGKARQTSVCFQDPRWENEKLCNGMRFLEDEGSPAVMNVHPFVQVKPASRQTEDDATSACTKLRALKP
ncbi:hypothetical protein ACSBR1_026626 [Camellia fascicularis]